MPVRKDNKGLIQTTINASTPHHHPTITINGPESISSPLATTLLHQLSRVKRVLVVVGAGISVSGGIPDFRSAAGLYEQVRQRYPQHVMRGADMFDARFLETESTRPVFHHFMACLHRLIQGAQVTDTHRFLADTAGLGLLARVYSQNIDDLEGQVGLNCGISKDCQVIQLHGSMARLRCIKCQQTVPFTAAEADQLSTGDAIDCPSCAEQAAQRRMAGKRAWSTGTLRPDIVLYNENHPAGDDISTVLSADLARQPDCLIVMGTSLKVHGLKRMVKEMARQVRSNHNGPVIYINQTALPGGGNSVNGSGNCSSNGSSTVSSCSVSSASASSVSSASAAVGEWRCGVFGWELLGSSDSWCQWLAQRWLLPRAMSLNQGIPTVLSANGSIPTVHDSRIDQYFAIQRPNHSITANLKPINKDGITSIGNNNRKDGITSTGNNKRARLVKSNGKDNVLPSL